MSRKNRGRDKYSANEQGKGFGQIPRVMVESEAYKAIKSIAAAKALPVFIIKWGCAEAAGKTPICNFHYSEAKRVHGIAGKSFSRGLRELHALGFIDISENGGTWEGNQWTETTYRRTERWRKFGTPDFITLPWTASEPSKKSTPPKRSPAISCFKKRPAYG